MPLSPRDVPVRPRAVPACLLALAATALGPTATAPGRGLCPGAGARPGRTSTRALDRATVCLVNLERRRYGLRPLRGDGPLAAAASGHAGDMSRRGYFSHASPTGASPQTRIRHHGYRCAVRRCPMGENIAWAAPGASPLRVVVMWMASPEHRANILARGYRRMGAGIGVRRSGGATAFYVTDFGG